MSRDHFLAILLQRVSYCIVLYCIVPYCNIVAQDIPPTVPLKMLLDSIARGRQRKFYTAGRRPRLNLEDSNLYLEILLDTSVGFFPRSSWVIAASDGFFSRSSWVIAATDSVLPIELP